MGSKYETVIGLEVHVQLSTKTKAFCGCSTAFGAPPNTQVCPVCLGLPGVLPVLNKKYFEYAVRVALALGCEIQGTVKFDRKNYYYPDLPKNYQISQYDMPLAYKGAMRINVDGREKDIGITRVHMEEDAGKLIHDPAAPFSYVDLNRTGTPLLEIVSEPDIASPEEAHEYLVSLKRVIRYLDVSDCNMEEGSLRCDANISLKKRGEKKLGSKVEVKNLNSFKAVRDALVFEQARQEEALEDGLGITQETRLWDEERSITSSMRTKEEAQDYRYFPEPDLVPFDVSAGEVEQARKGLPELPREKQERFSRTYGLSGQDIEVLISDRKLADFFENVVSEYNDPVSACKWVRGEVMMHIKERSTDIAGLGLEAGDLAKIVRMSAENAVSALAAKDVLKITIETGKDPEAVVKEKDLLQVSDEGALDEAVESVIAENEKSAADYRKGKTNALSFLVGQVMKKTKGKANPKLAGKMLRERLEG